MLFGAGAAVVVAALAVTLVLSSGAISLAPRIAASAGTSVGSSVGDHDGLTAGAEVATDTIPTAPAGRGTARGSAPRVGIRTFTPPAGIEVTANLPYVTRGTPEQQLDVCAPRSTGDAPRPAVLSIHGGSWTRGDKSNDDWRNVCEWLASEGFVTYSLDYRMVPSAVFPTEINDVTQALSWVREPANVARFNIDPRRIGVFGGSAGGNLAALLGMRGSGDTHTGTRVAAVAELSGPVDLTAAGQSLGSPDARLTSIELAYLGCSSFDSCPRARDASPVYDVDSSDPPTFIGGSTDEFVPEQQDEAFAAALQKAGVPHELHIVPGHWHSIATLDAPMRADVASFLHKYLDS
jgi:acetyl esterase/lipase